MSAKSNLQYGFKARAERIAEGYRLALGISKNGPLDAFKLADHLEIPIFSVKDIFEGTIDNHFKLLNNTDSFSAMWMPNNFGEKIIIHNDNHSLYRQQSNLMHELSHIIQKHEIPTESAKLCREFDLIYYNSVHEEEAKYLGGCLQIPRVALLWAFSQTHTIEEISNYYSASIEMVNYRINATGVMRQLHNRALKNI